MKRMKPCINSMWLLVTVLLVTALLGTAVNAETWKDIRDDIRMSNGNRALPKNHVLPSIVTNYTVTGFTGTPCEFPINPIQTTGLIVEIAWDFDADGQIDWRTRNIEATAKHQYSQAGDYSATCYIYDHYGEVSIAFVQASVSSGSGDPKIEPRKMVFTSSPSKRSSPTSKDGGKTYYMLMGTAEDRHWIPIVNAYYWAIDSLGVDSSLITVVAGNPDGDHWALDSLLDDTVIIDYGMTECDSAYNDMIQTLTSNDTLHVYQMGHGGGMYDSSVFVYGPDNVAPFMSPMGIGGDITSDDDPNDPDCKVAESDWLCVLNLEMGLRRNYRGLDQWAGRWFPGGYSSPDRINRLKCVSHYNNMHFDTTCHGNSDTTMSDDDVFIEYIIQYLACDYNHDGIEDSGEVWNLDSDSDGELAIDTTDSGYIFDNDEWGYLYLLRDTDNGLAGLFDSSLDNRVDLDPNYWTFEGLQIRGTDFDNDGLIVGVDMNEDGDMNDSAGWEEHGSHGTDDEMSEFLDSLDYALVTFDNCYCFGGGFIDDLSRDDVIIYTSTTEGTTGSDKDPLDFITRGNDLNGDSIVSFAEVFNYAQYASIHRLDDNGDRVGHAPMLPNGGDGALAAQVGFGKFVPLPQLPDAPTLVSTVGDTVNGLDVEFTWSLDTLADFYEVSYKLPDFPSLRGPNGWVTWGTYINDTTASLSLLDMSPLNKYSDIGHYWRVRGGLYGRDVDVYGDWSDSSSYYFFYDDACCEGIRGNLDGDTAQIVDISDLTYLINYLNLQGPEPECRSEACVSKDFLGYPDPLIDISDLNYLISYLYQQGPPPPDCR